MNKILAIGIEEEMMGRYKTDVTGSVTRVGYKCPKRQTERERRSWGEGMDLRLDR